MFTVKVVGDTRGILPKNANFQIRHLRNRVIVDGHMVNSTHGGYTIMVNSKDSRIFIAKCHENDQFNRRVGILTCLQRYIGDVMIWDYNFWEDGVTLHIDVDSPSTPHWIRGTSDKMLGASPTYADFTKIFTGCCGDPNCSECDPSPPSNKDGQ